MYQEIHELNIGLEEKIQTRTQTITNINAALSESQKSIKNLLDNAGQGFLSFSTDLLIKPDYSSECETLFSCNIGGLDFFNTFTRRRKPKTHKRDYRQILRDPRFLQERSLFNFITYTIANSEPCCRHSV